MGRAIVIKEERLNGRASVIDLDLIDSNDQRQVTVPLKMEAQGNGFTALNGHQDGDNNGLATPSTSGGQSQQDHDTVVSPRTPSQPPPHPVNGLNSSNVATQTQPSSNANGVREASVNSSEAFHVLGRHSRELIQVVRNLDSLNIKSTLPSLPKFVVVGDQSAGKSSIIEAICDITLPRSSGTCTRCPFEITTTTVQSETGPDWICQVKLRHEYLYDGRSKSGKDPKKFDRWTRCTEPSTTLFAEIDNKAQLDRVLRCAQLAILNPSEPTRTYQDIHAEHDFTNLEVTFSPNIVSLEISGVGLPELSLYDLPGAINRHEDEDEQHLVKFIEKLTKFYVDDEKTLVLLACAADTDVENSTAFRFVGECAATKRCMGVLTKADLLTSSRLPNIKKMLKGDNFRVGNSWFVTKQLSQEELDLRLSHSEAGELERVFFATDKRIAQISDFSAQFGIPAIQDAISQRLTAHIIAELPEIVGRVQHRFSEVETELRDFPERPVSAAYEVLGQTHRVATTVSSLINPESGTDTFRAAYRKLFETVRERLESLRPAITMRTPGFEPIMTLISDEEDAEEPMETPSNKSRKLNNGQAQRTPQRGHTGATPRATPRRHARSEAPTTESFVPSPARATFSLDEIQAELDRGSNTDIPLQTNPRVVERFIARAIVSWKQLVENLLTTLRKNYTAMLNRTIDEVLANRRNTLLHEEMRAGTETFFDSLWSTEAARIQHIAACETNRPITYHVNLLKSSRETIKTQLNDERRAERIREYHDMNPGKKLKADEKTIDDILGPDAYKREVETMAMPLAYYDIAAARMLDTIACHLDYGVRVALDKNLHHGLLQHLRVDDENYCQELVAEDPERERHRLRLLAELSKLQTALTELQSLSTHAA